MDIIEVRKKTGRKINQLRRMVWNCIYSTWVLFPVRTYRRTGEEKDIVFIMVHSMYGGGAERVASILANGLSENYHIITICNEKKPSEYYLSEQIERVYSPRHFRGPLSEQWRQREKFVRTYKKIKRPIASISLMYSMNRLNVGTKCGEAVICSERNNPAMREPEHMEEIASCYRQADHVVFQSSAVRNLFESQTASHSSIILNPVTVSCCKSSHNERRIVNIGRLHPQKNQALLIRAFAVFHKTHPGYTLEFYGIGRQIDNLLQLAESLGLSCSVTSRAKRQHVRMIGARNALRRYRELKFLSAATASPDLTETAANRFLRCKNHGAMASVIFHGNVTNIHENISDAMMFVLSSDYEGLSNALLECMMMGMPCISTDCTGSVDIIRSGENGILVERGNEQQLTEAMSLLADDKELREKIGRNASLAAEEFRPDKIIGQWKDLIESLKRERN